MMNAMDKQYAWLEAQALVYGTDEQRERWNRKTLPESELADIARRHLFEPLENLAGVVRWRQIKANDPDIKHLTHMGLGCGPSSVQFDTRPATELTAQQWAIRNRIERQCGLIDRHEWLSKHNAHCEIEAVEHFACCILCDATVVRTSVIVRIPWAGRMLAREYAL